MSVVVAVSVVVSVVTNIPETARSQLVLIAFVERIFLSLGKPSPICAVDTFLAKARQAWAC